MSNDLKILSVDLDGTLIKSDMLYETFWSAFAKDSLTPFKTFFALLKGKANLKNTLYKMSSIDIKSLPYNEVVIDYINIHRSNGGKVAMVTATTQELADDIAIHLNLFDQVHGSSSSKNLIGLTKANFQKKIFGEKNFDYIGNSFEDLESWKISDIAITLNASKSLKRNCEKNNNNSIHLLNINKPSFFDSFIKEIRLYQWIKNILVFIPMIAAQSFEITSFSKSFIAFIAFNFTASSVYIINDFLDIKADRNHPKKRYRPLASGDLSFSHGSICGFLLLIAGLIFGFILGGSFLKVLLTYFLLTLSYSIFLKKKEIIDIFILSGLYTLRIIAGGAATNLEISFWLLAFSIFIFFSLAAIKREAELIDLIDRGKVKIDNRGYKINDLDFIKILSITSGMLSTLVLALYINTPKVLNSYNNIELLWVVCSLFLFWIIRICFKTHRGEMNYDPVIFALKDRISNFIFVIIILLILLSVFL